MLESYASSQPDRVMAIPSLGQVRYLSAIKNSSAVIGNSSSGIIEAPSFNVPTVDIGLRQRGRLRAKSVLKADPEKDSIIKAIELAVTKKYKKEEETIENPYGRGDSSAQVIEMIKTLDFEPCKQFFDVSFGAV